LTEETGALIEVQLSRAGIFRSPRFAWLTNVVSRPKVITERLSILTVTKSPPDPCRKKRVGFVIDGAAGR
jgi:hypothetical protein